MGHPGNMQEPEDLRPLGAPTVAELAWAAGLIDGEGCIAIYRARRGTTWYRPQLYVGMTNSEAVHRLAAIFAVGGVRERVPYGRRARRFLYEWYVTSRAGVARTLRLLLPYLVVKWHEATLVLRFLETSVPGEQEALCIAISKHKRRDVVAA